MAGIYNVLRVNGCFINQFGVATCFPVSWSKSVGNGFHQFAIVQGHDILECHAELLYRYTYLSFTVVFECSLMISRHIIVVPINNFRIK